MGGFTSFSLHNTRLIHCMVLCVGNCSLYDITRVGLLSIQVVRGTCINALDQR